jgi:predicted fused transcriptional regulator/phosphomethylpyrimidine kinase
MILLLGRDPIDVVEKLFKLIGRGRRGGARPG